MTSPTVAHGPAGVRSNIKVSIIIPAKNEARTIAKCLDAVAGIDFLPEHCEVILVDNGSIDETIAVASSYGNALNLKIAQARGHISAVRNLGAALATGDLLAFLDADCAPPKDWLSYATGVWSPGQIVGAYYDIPPESSWVARIWYGYEYREKVGPVPFIPSGSLIISREAFVRMGGFDETIETNEDYEFCQRALASGIEVLAYTGLSVTHFGTPQTLAAFYGKQHWHGKAVMKVTLRNLRRFPNARAVSFGIYTLACLSAALLGLCLGVLRGNYLVMAGAMLALVAAPFVLGTRQAVRRRNIGEALPLALLFFTYGIARAHCLIEALACRHNSFWKGERNEAE